MGVFRGRLRGSKPPNSLLKNLNSRKNGPNSMQTPQTFFMATPLTTNSKTSLLGSGRPSSMGDRVKQIGGNGGRAVGTMYVYIKTNLRCTVTSTNGPQSIGQYTGMESRRLTSPFIHQVAELVEWMQYVMAGVQLNSTPVITCDRPFILHLKSRSAVVSLNNKGDNYYSLVQNLGQFFYRLHRLHMAYQDSNPGQQ